MATNAFHRPTDSYRCPACDGVLAAAAGSWGCTDSDCGYVPGHGAD